LFAFLIEIPDNLISGSMDISAPLISRVLTAFTSGEGVFFLLQENILAANKIENRKTTLRYFINKNY
jgi:hypothetical protein